MIEKQQIETNKAYEKYFAETQKLTGLIKDLNMSSEKLEGFNKDMLSIAGLIKRKHESNQNYDKELQRYIEVYNDNVKEETRLIVEGVLGKKLEEVELQNDTIKDDNV